MKMLCLMGLFPKNYEQTILDHSVSGVQNAANKFQWGIVNGLDEISDVDFKILNSPYIGSYPKRYKELKIPTFQFSHIEGAHDLNVGFTNLSLYKIISKYVGIKREIDKWIYETDRETQVVLAYAMTSPMVELLNYIKKKYRDVICCLVVPDLPEYMAVSAKKHSLYSIRKKIQIKRFRRLLKPVDCYVVLTKYMAEWFDWNIKYTVVEGICSRKKEDYQMNGSKKKKSVLYAGMLEKKYGIIDLAEAFMQIDAPEWSLELFGSGSALPELDELAQKDPRIHLRGIVPNAQVLAEQKEAEILINPRNDKNDFTKYSFPSKVIEYLSSGTAMVGYKLSGMSDEYTDYFYQIDPHDGAMKECLEKVMNLSSEERQIKGRQAFDFVTVEKGAKKQCEKIVALLDNCAKGRK